MFVRKNRLKGPTLCKMRENGSLVYVVVTATPRICFFITEAARGVLFEYTRRFSMD